MTAGPIALLADLHLEPARSETLFAALDETLEQILTHDPAELVILGDLVQETTPEGDRRMLERVVDRLEDHPLPYRCLPGNHDVEHLDSQTFCNLVGNDLWEIDQTADRVYLDSSAPRLGGSRGEVSPSQLTDLRESLATMQDALVFVHHPLHYQDLRDNYWFSEHPEEAFCGNKRAVREVLVPEADRIAAVLNGHLHEWSYVEDNGLAHFTIDSFNKTHNPRGKTGAYAILQPDRPLTLEHHAGAGTVHRVQLPE